MHGKLDLNLYVVLRAVYENGGITKAANALHIIQPAVSHALGRLQDKFDDPLFIRHGQKVVPTLPVHMYWHKHADEDLVNVWMRDKLLEVANKLGL